MHPQLACRTFARYPSVAPTSTARCAFIATRSACPSSLRLARLAFFDCDGVRLMLSTPEPGVRSPRLVVYFAMEDIRQMHETLRSRRVAFRTEPHKMAALAERGVWLADFEETKGDSWR